VPNAPGLSFNSRGGAPDQRSCKADDRNGAAHQGFPRVRRNAHCAAWLRRRWAAYAPLVARTRLVDRLSVTLNRHLQRSLLGRAQGCRRDAGARPVERLSFTVISHPHCGTEQRRVDVAALGEVLPRPKREKAGTVEEPERSARFNLAKSTISCGRQGGSANMMQQR
jgi:hypothetical protein